MSRAAGLLAGILLWGASPVSAEIVKFAHGGTLTVESCRFDGDYAVLTLKGGGELRTRRDLIAELLPDEAPFARQQALDRLATSPARERRWAPPAIRELIDRVAGQVGLDNRLAHALVRAESNYQPFAISPKGAMGLTQIMPITARAYALDDPFDPESNLRAGFSHLRRLLHRYGVRQALAAYNAGERAVAHYGGVPPYRETEQYVGRIMTLLR
jgi:soluble lytic murein transglycosylase-like protein